MRKLLAAAAALLLAATPAAAQQSAAAEAAPAPQPAVQAAAPSIWVSREEIRQRVAASESVLGEAAQRSESFWWLVTAIAVGVIIAALVL